EDHQAQQDQRRDRRPDLGDLLLRQGGQREVPGHVRDDRGGDEDDAAHRRRALLAQVGGGPDGANRLTSLERGEDPDTQRRGEQRDDERHRRRDDDRSHAVPSTARSASATSHVRYRDPFTRTTSPERNSLRNSSIAAS